MANITTFTLSAPSFGYQQTTDLETEASLKFIALFERIEGTYNGEFGFDWMRDNYKTICQNYDALKKEYGPIKIHDQEYFTPWLSMFPNQKGVKLKLKIKTIAGSVDDDDIVKLPSDNGVRFEPNEVKISEIKENGIEITVFCDKPLNQNITIWLFDKNNKKVGRLKVFKNDENLSLKIKIIKVKGNEVDNNYNERTFNDMTPDWESKLFKSLSEEYLNQALIKIEKDVTEEMTIDVEKYVNEGVLDAFIVNGQRGIPRYNKGFDKKLYEDFVNKHGDYKGIIFFLSSMHQQGQELGHAYPYPRERNYILMTPASIGGESLSYGHELGHTLGLHHPWVKSSIYETRLSKIENRENYLKKHLDVIKQYSDKTRIKNSNKNIGQVRAQINKELADLEKEKNDKKDLSPQYTFEKANTENIMDYDGYKTPEGKMIYNPNPKLITFWQWQWKIIIEEIKKYHGK